MAHIRHDVTFARIVPVKAVIRVRHQLLSARLSGSLHFTNLEFGSRVVSSVADGIFHGMIDTFADAGAKYLLSVEFETVSDLHAYYIAPVHSIIRREFLSSISDEIKILYEMADKYEKDRKEIYEKIEDAASGYMIRRDYAFKSPSD